MKIQFLSKEDCGLCDKALPVVERVCKQENISLEIIKIRKGDVWWDNYWDKIPVVLFDGELLFKYQVTDNELKEKILARM